MPKKDKTMDDGPWTTEEQEPEVFEPVVEEKPAQTIYYEPMMWKNIKPVFRCATCGTDRDSEDEIILHVVSHLPAEKQIEVLDQLTKKKE